ncbi:MAG: IS66 family transposase [Stenotrophomonas sp.]|uniref:IS66 family transposase n=1 Tax=Stenotrophomonas sp. TaxID=69392 RepID=UPI0029BD316C|nr:IS66 family transposase [Stenotrophomonas sp.]MDX3933814.1 IS66 family transposase [Stenotrophomonas sp.]
MNPHRPNLDDLDAHALREQARALMAQLGEKDQLLASKQQEILYKDTKIAQLTHEIAGLRRYQFGKKGERLSGEQGSLLDETVAADIAAIELELKQLRGAPSISQPKQQPKRVTLPAELPRIEHRHELDSTTCACGCQLQRIGEDVAEKLDYVPGVFSVERHIRGKWACKQCQTLIQAPVAAHVIDKGMASTGLLAQVLVAKYADHLPLYRQEKIFERAGMRLARSTMAEWVGVCGVQLQPLADALREALLAHRVMHADETPVQMLKPGSKKTHRAYLWAYAPGAFEDLKAVVYDFTEGRAGEHARSFLGDWQGSLICDDYSGYKALFTQGVVEIGCMAHARRKFFELHASSKSQLAEQALQYIGQLYEIERQVKDLPADVRRRIRQEQARPLADTLHQWMLAQRQRVPEGSATAKALDYSLKRWGALTRYLDDGLLPIDNNRIEQQIRPIAVGRNNWLFAGSLRAGRRAAVVMTLIQSAKLNGHDPYAYLKDVLTRLPTQPASRINELLPHNWAPSA